MVTVQHQEQGKAAKLEMWDRSGVWPTFTAHCRRGEAAGVAVAVTQRSLEGENVADKKQTNTITSQAQH